MASPAFDRRGGLLAILGSLLWTVGWIITLIAGGGSDTERVWRTLLVNPALLLFMIGLTGFHARQSGRSGQLGKAGFAVSLLGTGTMLVGNVVEFWVSEPTSLRSSASPSAGRHLDMRSGRRGPRATTRLPDGPD